MEKEAAQKCPENVSAWAVRRTQDRGKGWNFDARKGDPESKAAAREGVCLQAGQGCREVIWGKEFIPPGCWQ